MEEDRVNTEQRWERKGNVYYLFPNMSVAAPENAKPKQVDQTAFEKFTNAMTKLAESNMNFCASKKFSRAMLVSLCVTYISSIALYQFGMKKAAVVAMGLNLFSAMGVFLGTAARRLKRQA